MATPQTDSAQKRKGAKVFGSLERGLDKVITMLTPNKKRALRDGPRRIKVRPGGHGRPSDLRRTKVRPGGHGRPSDPKPYNCSLDGLCHLIQVL